MDDLGNRDSVNVRDGNNVDYDIDNLTNRYDSVGGNTLAYDAAGNLTADKDGYQYEYDYENRITKIIKSGPTTVAEFAYDALGRRIKKVDSVGGTTSIYYYNDKWQVLSEYNGSNSPQRWFAYGNYIDEVLVMNTSTSAVLAKLYVHDHLFSPVALVQMYHLDLKERYEYDAYGNCYVLEPNFAPDPDNKTDYGNPYQFTGRSLDVLDGGLLKIMQYRHRYYDTYTGRFTTHDPMGYIDGLNLYEYAKSNPVTYFDPGGWFACEECCGTDENYNKKVYNSVVRGLGALLSLYQRKDSADFGADWAKRTYVSHTEGMLAETSIEDEKDRIIEGVAQMYIDCFVCEKYFDFLRLKTKTTESYHTNVILARGIVSETTTWDIGLSTKVLLAWVIRNRVDLPNFPNTYSGVLSQRSQFSGYPERAYSYSEMPGGKEGKLKWAGSYYAAHLTTGGASDESYGADHFYSPYIGVPDWAEGRSPIAAMRLHPDYVRNVRTKDGTYFHGASFLFFDLIDENGKWRD